MGENGGINISDLAGLSDPLTKLIETVSCGIGRVYEPWYVKRMAKARAKELELISGAINDNLQLSIRYENGNISIDSTDANELVQRAQNRFLFQEMKKQQNIESVIGVAYSELKEATSVNDTPVDSDWISTFFDSVANVSTEQMQILWGKLLAGEVQRPGSFSLRTLNVLKHLNQNEAGIFQGIVPYVLRCPGDIQKTFEDYFLLEGRGIEGTGILHKYGIPFSSIMQLAEAGILSENSQIFFEITIRPGVVEYIKGIGKSIKIENRSQNGHILKVQHAALFLTEAGKELLTILPKSDNEYFEKYMAECLAEIKNTALIFPDGPIDPEKLSIKLSNLS